MTLGSTEPLTEMSTRNISWGVNVDNVTTFKCRLSRNLGASTFWNPKGLSRPVMGLRYLINFILILQCRRNYYVVHGCWAFVQVQTPLL
jgi:hypothetical protein